MQVTEMDLKGFAEEVHDFLRNQLTEDLREAGRYTIGTHSDIGASREWHRRLFEKGWIAPHWPVEHGGTGWSVAERGLFERESALNEAPILFAGGLRSLGPLLIEMGTRAQKAKYLPAILSGEHLWCQGFSEPGAGSDLAALQIKASREKDEYVLDGTKIWTTGAHLATHMFCLVRTSKGERPQEGMTFLLIDMKAPGLTVEPIEMLNGEHEFNQLFFDHVRVSVADRVGEEGDGWNVAKILMNHARSSNTTTAHLYRSLSALRRMAKTVSVEPMLAKRIETLNIRLSAFDSLEHRCRAEGADQKNRTTPMRAPTMRPSSMLKTLATELHQDISEVGMLLAGAQAIEHHEPYVFKQGENETGRFNDADWATAKYLGMRAASIYSGTSEVHRNLMARSLGLPR
ncbi:MAG: acyl-CoA dehydrogenase family protein [Parvibaculum sp.]